MSNKLMPLMLTASLALSSCFGMNAESAEQKEEGFNAFLRIPVSRNDSDLLAKLAGLGLEGHIENNDSEVVFMEGNTDVAKLSSLGLSSPLRGSLIFAGSAEMMAAVDEAVDEWGIKVNGCTRESDGGQTVNHCDITVTPQPE